MNEEHDEWTDEYGPMDQWTDEWTYEWTNEWTNEYGPNGPIGRRPRRLLLLQHLHLGVRHLSLLLDVGFALRLVGFQRRVAFLANADQFLIVLGALRLVLLILGVLTTSWKALKGKTFETK